MPASRLDHNSTLIDQFDVVGEDGIDDSFIKHVALANSASTHQCDEEINVAHMRPPLEKNGTIKLHTRGTASLTDDELKQIELFIDEHITENEAANQNGYKRYIIHPHTVEHCESDGTVVFQRFSCVGFAIEAYSDADIHLIKLDEPTLPMITMETIDQLYPVLLRIRNHPELAERLQIDPDNLGLKDGTEWPIVMPGYLFHALARESDEIREQPYSPQKEDAYFPHKN